MRGELPDDGDVALGELVAMAAQDVERAERPRLVQQRHDHRRVHVRHEADIARIGVRSLTSTGCSVATAAPTRPCPSQPERRVALRITDHVGRAQLPAPLVEQVDGERVERDQPADKPRDLLEEVVEIENAGDLAAQVEKRRDEFALAPRCPVRPVAGVLSVGFRSSLRRVFPCAGDRPPRKTDYTCKFGLCRGGTARCDFMDITLPLDYTAIERILPHRYPFLLVDRITELEPDKRIVGIKNMTLNERYLAHARVRRRCCRPSILTEAVAQVGAILILVKPENREKILLLHGHPARAYRRPVHPGDVVVIEAIVNGCAAGWACSAGSPAWTARSCSKGR